MSCTYDKERLTAFFDGELDAVERADTERHISGCSECLRDLGEIKSAALAVKSLPRPRAPRSIAEGVSREIAGAGRLGRLDVWRRRLFYGVAAAAALLVALNISYFTTAPAPREVAAAPAPAPGLALVNDKNAEPPQDGKEALAKDDAKALGSKEQSFNRQSPAGQDKGAGEGGARRNLEREKALDGVKQEAPGAAPKADAAPVRSEAKKELQAGAAPAKPSAPPAPPPAATPRPAEPELAKKAAEAPFADAKLKETKDADTLRARVGEQTEKSRALSLATAYTVGAPTAVDARAKVEALTRKWAAGREAAAAKAPSAKTPAAEEAPAPKPTAAPSAGAAFGRALEPMVVEVTPAQLEELQAELAKAGATIQVGMPEALARGGGGGKEGLGEVEARKRAIEPEADRRVDLAGPTVPRKVTIYFVEKK